ncbi:hypothetical protein XaFJ1_GM001217 [Xanthomonas albilineans]|nr:hypothetical protein XaFJ1_GM001217 [Xanthomonas albilineans]
MRDAVQVREQSIDERLVPGFDRQIQDLPCKARWIFRRLDQLDDGRMVFNVHRRLD